MSAPNNNQRHTIAVLVDNEPAGLNALATLLTGWGIEVMTAANGSAAETLLESREADAWILDNHLDAGDTGIDLRARLRERFGDHPAILVSADHGPELRALAVAVRQVIRNGLAILGVSCPESM